MFFNVIYVLALGDWIISALPLQARATSDPRKLAAIVLLGGIALPALTSWLRYGRVRFRPLLESRLGWLRVPRSTTTYSPEPTAWDHAAPKLGGSWIRVRLGDELWAGGWISGKSYFSTYPESRDIYIEDQYRMEKDGSFLEQVPGTRGCWMTIPDGCVVEWIEPDYPPEIDRTTKGKQ